MFLGGWGSEFDGILSCGKKQCPSPDPAQMWTCVDSGVSVVAD